MLISRTKLLLRTVSVHDARLCIIATEGTKTEKAYFDMFGDSRIHVIVLPTDPQAGGSAPEHVLSRLKEYRATYELSNDDSIWLMVDVDRWHGLQKSCKEAKQLGIGLAVSNPCFELWLLLHHRDADPDDKDCTAVKARLRATLNGYDSSNLQVDLFRHAIGDAVDQAMKLHTDPGEIWPLWIASPATCLAGRCRKIAPSSSPATTALSPTTWLRRSTMPSSTPIVTRR